MTTKDTKKADKKPKTGLWAVGAGALVLAAGAGAFFFTRSARADTTDGSKNAGKNAGGGSKGSGGKGADGSSKNDGGSKGPGGDPTDNRTPPKDDPDETPADKTPEDEREGYFWGDRSKVPEDFDWSSNDIWVSPDCSTVACGYWFWAEGTLDGKSSRVPMAKLVEAIGKDSDPRVRPPRAQFNGVGPEADLIGILSEHPRRTVYTWVGEYYGRVASAPGHSSTELAEDMMFQASTRTGGFNCMARRDLWPPAVWDFLAFAASRLDQFRIAAYGAQTFGG